MKNSLPTRRLAVHPDPNQIKRQAKELLAGFRAGEAAALAEVNRHFRGADPATFALHDAQLALSRAYGFESWGKLKARVDGVTVERVADAIRAGGRAQAAGMLKARPELAALSFDGLPLLHYAVLMRDAAMVRLLMKHGADARAGVYPHREATSALMVATERGYDDIVAAIGEFAPKQRESSKSDPPGELSAAVTGDLTEELRRRLDLGYDPDERVRVRGSDEVEFSWGGPLWHCAGSGRYEMARMLLARGADPNARVYASGSPVFQALSQGDEKMIALLREFGGIPEATSAGLFRLTELARQMLAGEAAYTLDGVGGKTLPEQLLWGGACGGDPEVVRMALARVDWGREDGRWFGILEQPLRVWSYGEVSESWDRGTYPVCFGLVLERCDPNLQGRFGLTILHSVAGSRGHVTAEERVAFAKLLLDGGARLDVRDGLLGRTPMEWARRWQRGELVELFRERGAAG